MKFVSESKFLLQALALLGEYIDREDPSIRIGAIMGLGIAYAGSQNEQVKYLGFFLLIYLAGHRKFSIYNGPTLCIVLALRIT